MSLLNTVVRNLTDSLKQLDFVADLVMHGDMFALYDETQVLIFIVYRTSL